MIASGSHPVRETGAANDPTLRLPGGRKTLYDIYSVGPPESPGNQRIANVRGSNIYYYSPYHYKPGPGVPATWVKITYGPNPKG